MSDLSEKIRRSRESVVDVGAHSFTIRRPTDMDMMRLSKSRDPVDMLQFVVGWDRVNEIDLIPGGAPHPVPFDADACVEWLLDQSTLLAKLVSAITAAYQAHQTRLEAAEKN